MDENDLKRYTVILGGGSGILFQPLDETITYILTAKHVLYKDVKDGRGQKTGEELVDKINFSYSNDQNNPIVFKVKKDENYFEHDVADAAILVLKENLGFNQIFIDERKSNFKEFSLTGYPEIKRQAEDKYDKHLISELTNSDDEKIILRLNVNHLDNDHITGFSGGGIIKINDDSLLLAGIQSKTPIGPCNGQINVVPINMFIEIVEENDLSEMIPCYLSNFSFLKDKIFNFHAGSGEQDIAIVKLILKRKALEVIKSEITPSFIKNHFKDKLLLDKNDLSTLRDELVYITWLEFLTFLNVIKSKSYTTNELIESQTIIRLIFNINDKEWLGDNFITDCLSYDYENLSEEGTIFIKTRNNPSKIKDYSIKRGAIVPNISAMKNKYLEGIPIYNGEGSDIFNAESESKEFIFDKYNFVHFEYLKYIMLVENSDEYQPFNRLNEVELLIKLREEYGKVFGI
ncbi:ABC-three component system protein [Myroides odoratimimus]|uniref:ABC-three component system protein n=1 Tax=Myroides odoratimimus TaxID=76832 RepID=UPI00091077FD|nr:ABC-three component system protein [Myroides odoratimimus]SHL61682.1 hypothetical protein SAMN05444275_105190 [Myroides odoratimimus subsp. xuanwuensis]